MKDLEVRYVPGAELRAEPTEGGSKIVGYAAIWNSDSHQLPSPKGKFTERITRGAFASSLKANEDVKAYWNHDTGKILARRSSEIYPLHLEEDDHGLRVEFIPPMTLSYGADAAEAVRTRLCSGMSFGFRSNQDKWYMKEGRMYRDLLDVSLYEVSLVSEPAYPETSVAMRSMERWEKDQSRYILESAKRRLRLADLA